MMRILGRVYPVPNARTVVQFTDPVLGACRTLFLHERILHFRTGRSSPGRGFLTETGRGYSSTVSCLYFRLPLYLTSSLYY